MFEFTEGQVKLRSMAREFADIELASRALELDKQESFPRDIAEKLGKKGIIGITAPEEFGGTAFGHLAGTIAVEELACVCPSIALFLEVTQTPMYAIEHYGTEEQKKKIPDPGDQG